MPERVLITGGAGFIGSHLTDALLARGYAVTILDDFSTGHSGNLSEARRSNALRVVEGSVLDQRALLDAIKGCGLVFHLAVQCVRRSLSQPIESHEINATGTIQSLEAARFAGVKRFIYCSSSEVYGNCADELLDEHLTQCAPVTIYGATKLAGEYYAKAYQQTYGVPVTIIRPFNAYGPRSHECGELAEVIPRFVIRVLNGLPPIIFGNGGNGRDFTYVTEVARGLAMAADCDAAVGGCINLAAGRMITVREVAAAVACQCGRPDIAPDFMEPRPGDVLRLRAATERARTLLGFNSDIDFDAGLARYVQWFRAEHNDIASLLEDDPRNWRMPTSGTA